MSARPFTDAEFSALSTHLSPGNRTRDRLLVVLGCATGFRIQELLSITVSQIWDGLDVVCEVAVARRELKGGRGPCRRSIRSRRVPLAEPVREAIRQHLSAVGTDDPDRGLFATGRSRGAGMNRSQAFRVLVQACAACGIDSARISTHTLRKTFAARVHRACGGDVFKTQRMLSHASPVTTARYLECDSAELDRHMLAAAA
jgi:integrase/recombinase XerD